MAALLGIWTLLHFSGMLLAPASKGHKVVFTGCLLPTVGGLGPDVGCNRKKLALVDGARHLGLDVWRLDVDTVEC